MQTLDTKATKMVGSFSPNEISHKLNSSMHELADLCNRLDGGEDLDDLMIETFAALKEQAAKYSDNAIALDFACDTGVEQSKTMREFWNKRKKTFEDIKKKLRIGILPTVQEHGDQIALSGSLGKILVSKGSPKTKYNFAMEDRSVTSVVTDTIIEMAGIPDEYLVPVTFQKLNKKKILDDLKAGKTLPFAELVREPSIQMRKA